MNSLASVRKLLEGLVESTASPIYSMCYKIASYLERNPMQRDLTVGGLRAALQESEKNDNILVQAAFALTAQPLEVLEVRYKLYDELQSDVLEEINHATYMQAISERHFIDDDGNDISLEQLNTRLFPYFINKFQVTARAGIKSDFVIEVVSDVEVGTKSRSMMESE